MEDSTKIEGTDPVAQTTDTSEPALPQAPADVSSVNLGEPSGDPAPALGGDNASDLGGNSSGSGEDVQAVPPATDIVHAADTSSLAEKSNQVGLAEGVVHGVDLTALPKGDSNLNSGGSDEPHVPEAADDQGPAAAPTTLEQPTANLASVGVGLGNNATPEVPPSPTVDQVVQADGHGGPAEVKRIIDTVHPEGSPDPATPQSKWGIPGTVPPAPVEVSGGIGLTPRSDAAANNDGWGARFKSLLGRGPKSPIQVTTTTVPSESTAPVQGPNPLENPSSS